MKCLHDSIVGAAILVLLQVGAWGCGGRSTESAGDTGEAESLSVDNCTLVTDEEATRLVGEAVRHQEDSPLGCPFSKPGETMGLFIVRAFAGKGPAKDQFGSHPADTTVHEVPGVGDSAAVLAREEHVNFLIVQKSTRYVQFVTTFVDDLNLGSERLKDAQQLALTALGRIK